MLIKVFRETFKSTKNPPALVIKTSGANFSHDDRKSILKKIGDIKGLPNIYLIHGELTNSEMNLLYNHKKIKTMISFSHGEGFGRPFAEFAVSNKPVIASNWSGHLDFLDKKYSILLPGQLKKVHQSALQKDIILQDSEWFYVDYNYASEIIKDVFFDYSRYTDDAKTQGNIIREKFTLIKMGDKLKDIFDKRLPAFPKEMSLKLPKLRKINNDPIEVPKLKLPKLKRISGNEQPKNLIPSKE
jgi:hypothetical protein